LSKFDVIIMLAGHATISPTPFQEMLHERLPYTKAEPMRLSGEMEQEMIDDCFRYWSYSSSESFSQPVVVEIDVSLSSTNKRRDEACVVNDIGGEALHHIYSQRPITQLSDEAQGATPTGTETRGAKTEEAAITKGTLADLIRQGIVSTFERIPNLKAIGVPWGSGDDIAPGFWAVFLTELENVAEDHEIDIYLCKWGGGKGPGQGVACLAQQRIQKVSFSEEVEIEKFTVNAIFHATYNARGNVIETWVRNFTTLSGPARSGGKRGILDEGIGNSTIQNNSVSQVLPPDPAYNLIGTAAAIRVAQNVHYQLFGKAAHNSGIKREVLAWIGVTGANQDYRCRHFFTTEEDHAGTLTIGRTRFVEYGPIEARRKFCNAFDYEKLTDREAWNSHIHIGAYHRLGEHNLPIPYSRPCESTLLTEYEIQRKIELNDKAAD
jgi:hypothetical protein